MFTSLNETVLARAAWMSLLVLIGWAPAAPAAAGVGAVGTAMDAGRRSLGWDRDMGWDSPGDRNLLVPMAATVAGKNYEAWSIEWWQRMLALPASRNWVPDPTGASCGEGQSGPVWFLSGGFASGDERVRTCTVPVGKFIFFPVINVQMDSSCPADVPFPDDRTDPDPGRASSLEQEFLRHEAALFIDPVKAVKVTVDGKDLGDLTRQRVTSRIFAFQGHPSLTRVLDPCINGKRQVAVSDGYWVMLEPLSPGTHTLHFEGHSFFDENVTYHLVVKEH